MSHAIYLFHGEDSYSSQQKANRWQREFIKKYDEFNTQLLEGENLTAAQISEALNTVPFIVEKKLIIVRDFLRESSTEEQKKVAEKLEETPDYCVLVFVERQKADARLTLFKKIKKIGQIVDFNYLEKPQLTGWIQQEVAKKNGQIGTREAAQLADTVGPDLWQMSHEIEKLTTHDATHPIKAETIEALVTPNLSESIFKLTDYLAQRNRQKSTQTLNTLVESGEDLMQIFHMIVRHFRILIQVHSCISQGMAQPQIVQKTKEHPYAVMTSMKQCNNFDSAKLTQIYRQLLGIDIAIKSGKIKMTTEDKSELRLSLEKLFVELCA